MVEESYKKALHDAREELLKLLPEKRRIDERVAQLKQTVSSLAALCGDEPDLDQQAAAGSIAAQVAVVARDLQASMAGKPGLTDAIRSVLKTFDRPMWATEVRDGLTAAGYDFTGQTSPLISIVTVLKRLDKEVIVGERDGRPTYQWKPEGDKKDNAALAGTLYRRPKTLAKEADTDAGALKRPTIPGRAVIVVPKPKKKEEKE